MTRGPYQLDPFTWITKIHFPATDPIAREFVIIEFDSNSLQSWVYVRNPDGSYPGTTEIELDPFCAIYAGARITSISDPDCAAQVMGGQSLPYPAAPAWIVGEDWQSPWSNIYHSEPGTGPWPRGFGPIYHNGSPIEPFQPFPRSDPRRRKQQIIVGLEQFQSFIQEKPEGERVPISVGIEVGFHANFQARDLEAEAPGVFENDSNGDGFTDFGDGSFPKPVGTATITATHYKLYPPDPETGESQSKVTSDRHLRIVENPQSANVIFSTTISGDDMHGHGLLCYPHCHVPSRRYANDYNDSHGTFTITVPVPEEE